MQEGQSLMIDGIGRVLESINSSRQFFSPLLPSLMMVPSTHFPLLFLTASILLIHHSVAVDLNGTSSIHPAIAKASKATRSHCPPQPNKFRAPGKNAKKFLPAELIRAVYAGDLAKLKKLVTSENILLRDGSNDTLAHLAAEVGNVEMLRFLINKEKTLIESKNNWEGTPLVIATWKAHRCVVKFLLEQNGADPNVRFTNWVGSNISKSTYYKDDSTLHQAAFHGHLDIVKILLQHEANISARDEYGDTPLHAAVYGRHLEIVKYLAEWRKGRIGNTSNSPSLLFTKDNYGDIPIHDAASYKLTNIVRYLASVDPRQLAVHGRYNMTVLHIAAYKNDTATLRVILQYQPSLEALANFGKDSNGTRSSVTALMVAAWYGHERIVRMLLDAGANDTAVDLEGDSSIHLAAMNGHYAVVEVLLEKKPRNVNLKGSDSYTPLHYAVENQHYGVVRLLLKQGADISDKATYWSDDSTAPSWTPLLFAAVEGNFTIFQALVESGARVDKPDPPSGMFPIHLAALNGRIEVAKEILARHPCQLEVRGGLRDRTPLSFAVNENQTEMAEYLIEKGADVEAKSHYWKDLKRFVRGEPTSTPLIFATQKGNYGLMEALLRHGANPNVADEYGSSTLHYAAILYDPKPSEILIRYGAEGGRENIYGETPLEIVFNNFYHSQEQFVLLVVNDPLPLHRAVVKENVALLRKAVRHLPTRLNQRNPRGESALEMAVRLGNIHMAMVLIEAGVRVDSVNDDGNTLLHTAASNSNATKRWKLVELILHELGDEAKPLLQLRNGTKSENIIDVAARDPVLAEILRRSLGNFSSAAAVSAGATLARRTTSGDKYSLPLHDSPYVSSLVTRRRPTKSRCRLTSASSFHPKAAVRSLPTDLLKALYAGDLPRLKALLTRENILLRDTLNNTLAVLAAQRGEIGLLRYLISKERSLINAKGMGEYSPLHIAAKRGHTAIVEHLLRAGADVDAIASGGRYMWRGASMTMQQNDTESIVNATVTPLHLATREGHIEIAKLLLRHGANITASDWRRATPLHWAAGMGHLEVVKQLVSYSIDSSSRDEVLFAQDVVSDIPIHYAAYGEKANVVDYLASVEPHQLSRHGLLNKTVLHIAASKNDAATLRAILKCKPNLELMANFGNDPNGPRPSVTALMLAAWEGYEYIVRMLLEAGANDTTIYWRGDSAIHVAAEAGHKGIIEALLDKNSRSVNLKGNRSYTPLHRAVMKQRYEVVLLLLKRGANMSAKATYWYDPDTTTPSATPLLFAAAYGDLQIFRALLERGARADQPDSQTGLFPIHLAAHYGSISIVEELLARDPCQLEWRGGSLEYTPLVAAIKANRTEMAKFLIRRGAVVEAKSHYNGHMTDDEPSVTPLIWAIRELNQKLVEALLLYKANPNTAENSGLTPLHASLRYSIRNPVASRIIELLIRHGALAGVEDVTGQTSTDMAFAHDPDGDDFRLLVTSEPRPLHRAVAKDEVALLRKAVLHLPSRLDERNPQGIGETALEMAMRLGKVEVASALIEAGLRVDTINADGNTLIHIASSHSNTTIRAQLVEMIERDASASALPILISHNNKTGVSVIDIARRDPIVGKRLHKLVGGRSSAKYATHDTDKHRVD